MPSLLGLQPQTLLQLVLDNVGVALAVIDHEGRFAFTNQAAHKLFGATGDLTGTSLEDWRRNYVFYDRQGREITADQAPMLRALAGEEVKPQEVRITLPDGRVKWLHAAAHAFSVLGLQGVFVIVTDETEQVELRRALERAQRMEVVGLLAGELAHDLNNMLSVISENLAIALSDSGVPETTRDRLHHVEEALDKGVTLATRLVHYGRPQKMQISPVHINDVVNASLELARPLLKDRVRVTTDLGQGLPNVEVDPSRMEQVLLNLIVNAIDAMPEGGELALHTEFVPAGTDSGAMEKDKPSVLITVTDTGAGIPENLQASIFNPFFTTKPHGRGAGLGLSSARAIVHQHNGDIKVQSAPGLGSKFSIYLPAEEESWAKEKSG